MRIVVLGSATIVAPIIDALDYQLVALLNDRIPIGETEGRFVKYKVVGSSEDVHKWLSLGDDIQLAITVMTMKNKRGIWEKMMGLNVLDERFATLIHPSAEIPWSYVDVGRIIVAPLVQLSPGAQVKDQCILYSNSFVGHDSTLEKYVVVANNASINARVKIERGAHIGSNSTILSGITIGEFAVVGAGSVVTKDVPPDTIVVGVPAKKLRSSEKPKLDYIP